MSVKGAVQSKVDNLADASGRVGEAYKYGKENPETVFGDNRGQVDAGDGLLGLVVSVSVGLLVFSILGSISLDQFANVDTTSWDPEVVDMWNVVPVLMLVAVILGAIIVAIDPF